MTEGTFIKFCSRVPLFSPKDLPSSIGEELLICIYYLSSCYSKKRKCRIQKLYAKAYKTKHRSPGKKRSRCRRKKANNFKFPLLLSDCSLWLILTVSVFKSKIWNCTFRLHWQLYTLICPKICTFAMISRLYNNDKISLKQLRPYCKREKKN